MSLPGKVWPTLTVWNKLQFIEIFFILVMFIGNEKFAGHEIHKYTLKKKKKNL